MVLRPFGSGLLPNMVVRVAYSARDGTDVDSTVIDVPAVGAFRIAAAGELGQVPIEAPGPTASKSLQLVGLAKGPPDPWRLESK
jgi:hypothetical protein